MEPATEYILTKVITGLMKEFLNERKLSTKSISFAIGNEELRIETNTDDLSAFKIKAGSKLVYDSKA